MIYKIWNSYMILQYLTGHFKSTKCCANEKDFKITITIII